MNDAEMNLSEDWKKELASELEKPYFQKLWSSLEEEYSRKNSRIYPPKAQIFRALNLCPLEKVKVVIVGQDPYPKEGQADGLCFSCSDDSNPKSLKSIFYEIENNFPGKEVSRNNDLTRWAKQGVLLLNSKLSFQAKNSGSHRGKNWGRFTNAVIESIDSRKGNGVVFLLWGAYAREKEKLIKEKKNIVLTYKHPVLWKKSTINHNHFKETNDRLESKGLEPIDWWSD